MSRNQLKKALKQLKEGNNSPEKEIVYVSELLRSKFGKQGNKLNVFKQELKFKENFWKFCKSNLETKKDQMGVLTFDEKSATMTLGIHVKLNTEINVLTFSFG